MRKILLSSGHVGWSTTVDSIAEKRFMLEYAPFIEAIENGLPLDIERWRRDWASAFPCRDRPYDGEYLRLEVHQVPDGSRIRVFGHNSDYGDESYETEGEFDEWL